VGNGEGGDADLSQGLGIDLQGRHPGLVEGGERRDVVGQPGPGRGIEGQNDDPAPDHPPQFTQAGEGIGPVVDRQHGEPGLEGALGKGKGLGDGPDGGRSPRRPLADHLD